MGLFQNSLIFEVGRTNLSVAAVFLKSLQVLVPGSQAIAGGVMMFITLDELIPTAREYGHQHYTAVGIIFGSIFVFLLSGIFGV